MELYYRRSNGVLETVVFFIPDISTCVPSEEDWRHVGDVYRLALGESEQQKEKRKLKERTSTEEKEIKKEATNDSSEKKDDPVVVVLDSQKDEGSIATVKEEHVDETEPEVGVSEETTTTMEVVADGEMLFLTFLNLYLFPCGTFGFPSIHLHQLSRFLPIPSLDFE